MDLPCRSCKTWSEKHVEVWGDFPGGICNGSCAKGISHEKPQYLTYGVGTQERGCDLCAEYEHEGFQW